MTVEDELKAKFPIGARVRWTSDTDKDVWLEGCVTGYDIPNGVVRHTVDKWPDYYGARFNLTIGEGFWKDFTLIEPPKPKIDFSAITRGIATGS
jgi:hypothetical protein